MPLHANSTCRPFAQGGGSTSRFVTLTGPRGRPWLRGMGMGPVGEGFGGSGGFFFVSPSAALMGFCPDPVWPTGLGVYPRPPGLAPRLGALPAWSVFRYRIDGTMCGILRGAKLNADRAARFIASLAIATLGVFAIAGTATIAASASQGSFAQSATARPAVIVPGTWKGVSTFNPFNPANPHNSLNGVSCAGPTFCVSVGASSTIDHQSDNQIGADWFATAWNEDNGLTPAASPTNSMLNAVSCVASFCMAVGAIESGSSYVNEALVSNAVPSAPSWGSIAVPNPGSGTWGNSLVAVSCVTSTSCVAVDTFNPTGGSYSYSFIQWTARAGRLRTSCRQDSRSTGSRACKPRTAASPVRGAWRSVKTET